MRSIKIAAVAAIMLICAPAYATTPAITGVSGTISTGQTLTITGTTMMDRTTTDWYNAGYDFEGSNYAADGYDADSQNTGTCVISYDTNIKLVGNKSVSFRQHQATTGPSQGACGLYTGMPGNDFYVSSYVRWTPTSGTWPDEYLKLFLGIGTGQEFYFQPETVGSTPTRIEGKLGDDYEIYNLPGGALQTDKWYYLEAHYKNTAPKTFQIWVNNSYLGVFTPTQDAVTTNMEFGLVNMCCTNSSWDMTIHMDNYVISTSRIYPISKIEISDNSTYGAGTLVWQYPTTISDITSVVTADLTGLGAGPYYLFVTNNKNETSDGYLLGGSVLSKLSGGGKISGGTIR